MGKDIKERSVLSEQYFHREIDRLLDDIYGRIEDVQALYDCHRQLQGALAYARHVGDVDAAYYRIFSDMLTGIADDVDELSRDLSKRKQALAHKRETGSTLYFFDDIGMEYWYTESDTRRHYTCSEG